LLLAVALRDYCIAQLPSSMQDGVQLVSVYERPTAELDELYQKLKEHPEVGPLLREEQVNMAYVMPGDYFLTGLVIEEGPRFSEAVLERHPQLAEWHERRFQGGVKKFLRLFKQFWGTWSYFRTVYDIERFVFIRVTDFDNQVVPPDKIYRMGGKRIPVLVVDMDSEYQDVLSVVRASGGNLWGKLPMPNF
jgi:hypothetical protein